MSNFLEDFIGLFISIALYGFPFFVTFYDVLFPSFDLAVLKEKTFLKLGAFSFFLLDGLGWTPIASLVSIICFVLFIPSYKKIKKTQYDRFLIICTLVFMLMRFSSWFFSFYLKVGGMDLFYSFAVAIVMGFFFGLFLLFWILSFLHFYIIKPLRQK